MICDSKKMLKLSDVHVIEKAVAKTGINVPLRYIENSQVYQNFTKQLGKAIQRQIATVAQEDEIKRLMMFTKAVNPQLVVEVAVKFVSLEEMIDLEAFLLTVGSAMGKYVNERYGITGTFALTNKELVAYFDDHSRLILNTVDDTTKKWIATKIQEGKSNNLNPFEIKNMIIDEAKGITEARAKTIVLTETANAMSVVQREVALRYGVDYLIWNTSEDEKVCPICLPLDNKKSKIDGTFEGGYNGPPAHPNCRCFMTEEIVKAPEKQWLGE